MAIFRITILCNLQGFSIAMKKLLFLACIACCFSCSSVPKLSPSAYNDSLVIQQVKVVEAADRLQAAFDTYVKEEMQLLYERFVVQIDQSIAQVEKLEAYEGDASFREATLQLLTTYKKLAEKEYREAKTLLSKPDSIYSPGDEARLELLYKQIDRLSMQATQSYRKVQEHFAREHGLMLAEESGK